MTRRHEYRGQSFDGYGTAWHLCSCGAEFHTQSGATLHAAFNAPEPRKPFDISGLPPGPPNLRDY